VPLLSISMSESANKRRAIKKYGLSFLGFLNTNKIHFLILIAIISYVILAPIIYAHYFVQAGKPIKVEANLPNVTDEIIFSFDSNGSAIFDGQKLHQLNGWAFIPQVRSQSKFNQYLVLNSGSRTYFFSIESVARSDLRDFYLAQGQDEHLTGFNVLISGDNIRSGVYNIGFLFQNTTENREYYSVSNRYLVRTPNLTYVQIGLKPEINASGKLIPGYEDSFQDGLGIKVLKVLPTPTTIIQSYVDGLSQVSINGEQYNRLVGWAFVKGEIDQTRFERIIVMKSLQDVYYFPAISFERPDVQVAFARLDLDLRFSGFETYMLEETLPPGKYEIGIIFRDKTRDVTYYSKTTSSITWSSDQIDLHRK